MSCCNQDQIPFTKYSILNAGVSVIRHYLDPTYDAFTPQDVKQVRLETCYECEELTSFMGKKQCKICKCFVEPKAALNDQICPYPKGRKW